MRNLAANPWWREIFLFRSARDARLVSWAIAETGVILVLCILFYGHVIWRPVPLYPDGHLWTSINQAMNQVFCGKPSHVSPTSSAAVYLHAHPELDEVPLRDVVAKSSGSLSAYCSTVTVPWLNNENSLLLLARATLTAMPRASFRDLRRGLVTIQVLLLVLFLFALLDAGASVLFAFLAFAGSLQILANYQKAISVYPFAFTLLLGCVALCVIGLRHAAGSWRRHLIMVGLLGLYVAFAANMRTSYLPIFLACIVVYSVGAARTPNGPRRPRAAWAWALAGLIVPALLFVVVSRGLVWWLEGRDRSTGPGLPYHVIMHPIVLALGIPESELSRREGIRWDDGVGPELAARANPGVKYLELEYEVALWRYYAGLWKRSPGEMLAVYVRKARAAGLLQTGDYEYLIYGRRFLRRLLWPLTKIREGLLLTATYAFVAGLGLMALWRHPSSLRLLVSLCALVALALQLEATVIVPGFHMQLHGYLLMSALLGILAAMQAVAQGTLRWRAAGTPFEWRSLDR
jgi:hypothetical protein